MNGLGVPHDGSGGGPWGSGVPHGVRGAPWGHGKVKNYFFLKHPKIMFPEKNYFSPFRQKFSESQRVKKVKNYIFLKT